MKKRMPVRRWAGQAEQTHLPRGFLIARISFGMTKGMSLLFLCSPLRVKGEPGGKRGEFFVLGPRRAERLAEFVEEFGEGGRLSIQCRSCSAEKITLFDRG